MQFKLFKKIEEPPTNLLNPSRYTERGRCLVPVTAVPHEDGWLVETEDPEAASCALKDYGFLLVEPEVHQFPVVPNFSGDVLPSRFKFKKATPEEISAGKYLTFVEQKAAERLAEQTEIPVEAPSEEVAAGEAPQPEIPAEAAPMVLSKDEEIANLRKMLSDAGINAHARTGIAKLRAMVAELPASKE